MERYSYMENHQAFMDSTSNQVCSSPGTFFGGSRLMGNLSISNRNSVLTDDSGVFEDAISKSDSIDFGDPSNPLLSFSSPAPRSRKSESEQCDEADSPEQLEACMNPLFMMNSWGDNSNSPEHQKKPTDPSPKHQQLQQTNSVTENKQNTSLSSNNQDPNSETKTETVNGIPKRMPRPNSIDLLSFDHYAATYQSSSSDSRYKGRFRIEETTPTPAKKLVNSLNCSPMKEANNNFSGPQFSNEVVIRPIGVNHNNNRRISYIECDSVEALNSEDPPNSSNNDPTIITSPCFSPPTSSASSLSQLNIYLDDGCTLSDTQESTLTYNSLDGFYEDNPILQGCNFMSPTAACSSTSSCNTASSSNSSSGSASGSKRNSTRRKISSGSNTNQNRHQNQQQQQSSSSSITSPSCQLRSQQPRVAPKYEKAHLYPKKYGKTESMPEHQIYVELHQLEEMLKELQMKGTQIEQVLHCIGKESGAKTRSEESVLLGEWLELVRSKNRIVRRENELMHILNQRELEEIQEAIIDKMRHLMTIEEKSDVEKAEEERLLANLLQVVEKRNGIVQILEQDRLNEEIEDQKCEDLLSPEKLRDATTRQKTWKSVMSTFKTSKWANNVKSYYNLNSKSLQY